jgi:hypothetical protein
MDDRPQTSNLIRLFLYTQGTSEIPRAYQLWAFLAVMAATVADRVGIKKFSTSLLSPNLYTLLVGPAGCGKGEAIEAATQLVENLPGVRLYAGPITAQSMYKRMHLEKNTKVGDNGHVQGSKIFLVHEELAMDVGEGHQARDFIRYMTGLYKPKKGKQEKDTVTGGRYILKDTCINWLAGTTKEWLTSVITANDLRAGFGRRVLAIEGRIDPNVRYVRPIYPDDADEVKEHIRDRLGLLAKVEGEFTLTPEAKLADEAWYLSRPPPVSEDDLPVWRQAHDLSYKIAQLVALASGSQRLVIRADHMLAGQQLTDEAQAAVPNLIRYVTTSMEVGEMDRVAGIIQRAAVIERRDLIGRSRMVSARLDLFLRSLIAEGIVVVGKKDGNICYVWKAK